MTREEALALCREHYREYDLAGAEARRIGAEWTDRCNSVAPHYRLGFHHGEELLVVIHPLSERPSFYYSWQHRGDSSIPARAWVALGQILTMFESWQAGRIKHLPPSCNWDVDRGGPAEEP